MTKDFAYRAFAAAGGPRLMWPRRPADWRVLNYHGICPDEVAAEPWVPSFFVSESRFREQLSYLKAEANVVSVEKALNGLQNGSLPERAVSITIDDGYANNLYRALPILREFDAPATIYVSTHYVERGDFYIFDRIELLRQRLGEDCFRRCAILRYHTNPIGDVFAASEAAWLELRPSLSEIMSETLRPLTVSELQTLAQDPLITIGGHTHRHCIFSNETPETRRAETHICLSKLRDWLRREIVLFSYPNGEAHNFTLADQAMLQEMGIASSFSMIRGNNHSETDRLALRRYSVSITHDRASFVAEICGFREAVRRLFASRKD